jgi:hypothetical protein
MIELPDVSLVAIFTVAHELTRMAVKDCTDHANFGEVLTFSDHGGGLPGPFSSMIEGARFSLYEALRQVKTSHILSIQWDGYLVNPDAWTDEFLEYDYIGAPWCWFPDMNVGNSGFCLRSRRLIEHLFEHQDEFPIALPEDEVLCRKYRPELEKCGFRWAPVGLASRFSFERVAYWPLNQIFGYHNMVNWPKIMTPEQIEARMAHATPYVTESAHYKEMRAIMAGHN